MLKNKKLLILIISSLIISSILFFAPNKEKEIFAVNITPEYPPAPKIRTNIITAGSLIVLENMDFKIANIIGGSMTPAIGSGSKIAYITIPYEDVIIGDLVLVKMYNDEVLFHQIVEKNPEYFRTKSFSNPYIKDANKWEKKQLIGVAIAVFY